MLNPLNLKIRQLPELGEKQDRGMKKKRNLRKETKLTKTRRLVIHRPCTMD